MDLYVNIYLHLCLDLSMSLSSIFYLEIYHEAWAHTILEAENSHSLLSASWKPRKTSPRTKVANSINSRLGSEDEMSQLKQQAEKKRKKIPPLSLGSIPTFKGLDSVHPHWERDFSAESTNSTGTESTNSANFTSETPSRTHLEIMFKLGFPQPVKVTYKINHLMYTKGKVVRSSDEKYTVLSTHFCQALCRLYF